MEKKKKRAPEIKLTRTTIIALIVLVLATIVHFAVMFRPERLVFYDGFIIYPFMKHWQAISFSIFFVILVTIVAYFANSKFTKDILNGIFFVTVMINCSLIAVIPISNLVLVDAPFEQIDNIHFNEQLYYLVMVSEIDSSYTWSHVVYKCDVSGITCQKTIGKSTSVNTSLRDTFTRAFTLSQDKSELYVIIGDEEFLVATQSP